MKKLFVLLFLIVLFSCEKEESTCWECTTITVFETIWLGTNYSEKDFWSEKVIICDHTEIEIRAFEDKKTYTSDTTILSFYYGYVIKNTCYCIK